MKVKPNDPANTRLIETVRPRDYENPKPDGPYRLVVIGGGTAGLVAAGGAAMLGAKVALVERAYLGGDCLISGCVPSKAILKAGRMARAARQAVERGFLSGDGGTLRPDRALQHLREARAEVSSHDSLERFREMGVDVYYGEAAFEGPDRLSVGGTVLRFKRAVIATGSRANIPKIEGLDEVDYLTNASLFEIDRMPDTMAVIGGGPIGCEMAQAFANLGVKVSLLQRGPKLLPKDDPEAAEIVAERLRREGVDLRFEAETKTVSKEGERKRVVFENADGKEEQIECEVLLIATGRQPNVEEMDLEKAGVDFDQKRGILVNDFLQTGNRRIYASGDCCMKQKFTHAADEASRVVLTNALFFPWARRLSSLLIPHCTYTEPPLAHVGISPEAAEKDADVDVLTETFGEVDRAIAEGETAGFCRIYHHRKNGRILGATLVGAGADDIISELTVAIQNKIKLPKLSKVIHPYPTRAETIKHLADQFSQRQLQPFKPMLRWWLK